MCIAQINKWFGRNGNNFLQIVHCLYYSTKIKKCNKIILPSHPLLITKCISFDTDNICKCTSIIDDLGSQNYYYRKKLNIRLTIVEMRKLFQKFIKVVDFEYSKLYDIGIHIRSGDVFSQNPHNLYVQPPLDYYKKFIDANQNKNIMVVYEDDKNPCIQHLKRLYPSLLFQSSNVKDDIQTLVRCDELVIGFSSFVFVPFLLSSTINKIHLPDYVKNHWLFESGENIFNVINLPKYIKPGEWKNSKGQLNLMITYNI